jgi:DNA-binding transcriptional MerR regulator
MEKNMLIGEICRKADCTPRTVRHYEAEKLIAPVDATPGGRKLYSIETVSTIRTVKLLKRLGYSLKDILKIIRLTHSLDTRRQRVTQKIRNILSDSLTSIDKELALLNASRVRIADLIEKTETCRACATADCKDCGKLRDLRTLGLLFDEGKSAP